MNYLLNILKIEIMVKKSNVVSPTPENAPKSKLPLDRTNLLLMLVGLAIIIIGFLLMAGGGSEDVNNFNASQVFSFRRTTLAPVVVIFGFAFEIYAIMRRPRTK